MHWFNTASAATKQRYAAKILENIKQFKDLMYYGFISIQRLNKILAYAKKELTPDQRAEFPSISVSQRPYNTFEQAESYARVLANTADWPFYFFGDEDLPEKYWGLTRLDDLKSKEKTRQDAKEGIENIKYYRALCYYGFITSEKATELFQQFTKYAIDSGIALVFPKHLDPKYTPTVSFDQAHRYACALAKQKDWSFYTAEQSQHTADYWGLDHYQALKNEYERYSGVGNFFGILFTASGLFSPNQSAYFPMKDFNYQMAKRKVAAWCWAHRHVFVLCTHPSNDARTPLIIDRKWIDELLTASAHLAEPGLSEKSIESLMHAAHQGKPYLSNLYLIRFLENIRQNNEAILTIVEKEPRLFKQYKIFSGEKRSFLQAKTSLENYFDRSKVDGSLTPF